MRSLLYIALAAFSLWLVSESIKAISGGFIPTVYYLNTAYHLLAAIGIWGLHLASPLRGTKLSSAGAFLISASFLVLAFYPFGLMNSGLDPTAYLDTVPHFQAAGLLNLLGFVLFGLAAMREPKFPKWIGAVIALGSFTYKAAVPLELGWLALASSFGVSLAFIYLVATVFKHMESVR